jgi:hypothetical protein
MSDKIAVLPVWKKGASAAERFEEFASYARAHPERFEQFVLCYRETTPNGRWKFRVHSFGCQSFLDGIGMFHMGAHETVTDSEP